MSPAQVRLEDVTVRFGDQLVLDGVTHTFATGRTTGLIGENGSGKSTLLRVIAGDVEPDAGRAAVVASGGVLHVMQNPPLVPGRTVGEVCDDALVDVHLREMRMRTLEDLMANSEDKELDPIFHEYADIEAQHRLMGGYRAESDLAVSLATLGVGDIPRSMFESSLSGGQRARLYLAAAMISSADLLLLDEPTNHLDDAAIDWIQKEIARRVGTIVLVTHDRVLLDAVADTLLEVDGDNHRCRVFGGGYSGYLEDRRAQRQRQTDRYELWKVELRQAEDGVEQTSRKVGHNRAMRDNNKAGYNQAGARVDASVSTRVRTARRRLSELMASPVAPPAPPLKFAALPSSTPPITPLQVVDLSVRGRLRQLSFDVAPGARLLVEGANGSGKSTLFDAIAGVVAPTTGQIRGAEKVAYLRQHVAVSRPDRTVINVFSETYDKNEDKAAAELVRLGLMPPRTFHQKVSDLSEGQRRRLHLAQVVSRDAEVLLLDEPTNHLSLQLVEELEEACFHFCGTLLVVSHDRRWRRHWKGPRLTLPPINPPSN